ncbi:LIG4 [Cordylochernes scorpioides]|uniref:LIG4 n=1 Tax=Cordylochernes scorpioides TaxID=51811 RepID=A0ABY6LR47_9ARAC|nr:LIG4 [Cordylochernes scorpioides]
MVGRSWQMLLLGVDLSTNYGASGTEGPLTRHLHPCFSQVSSCILDGEMVGFNVEQDCIGTKGEGLDVKHLADGKDFQQCYCVFDILMLNDRVLTSLPYTQRLALLAQHLQPLSGRLIITSSQEASGKETVVEALNQAIELREEGIMLKLASSIYKPNSRSSGWYKVKPEYVDGLMDQLDLLIVGGYYGGGRRRSGVSHFLVAAASGEGHWVSVTSVGSGYSMAELASLLARLQPHWRTWDSPPPHLVLGSGGTVPDLWLPPQHSAVLQVTCWLRHGEPSFFNLHV